MLQQLWDCSGFIDLSKEPQPGWAGAEPGPQHPGNYQSGTGNHSVKGFHTYLERLMVPPPDRATVFIYRKMKPFFKPSPVVTTAQDMLGLAAF